MKVVATKASFFNGRRVRVGDEVVVPDGTKASWFAAIDTAAAKDAKTPKAGPAKDSPKALSQMGGEKTKTFTDVHGGADSLA